MQLIDTHCHMNFVAYKDDWKEVLERSLAAGIGVINVGTKLQTSKQAIAIAEKYEDVYAIIGLHPIHIHEQDVDEPEQDIDFHARGEVFDKAAYKELAQHKSVVGIGEMGIDYFHMPETLDPEQVKVEQKHVFLQGLEIAKELDLPVTVHTRPSKDTYDAYDDVLQVIDRSGYSKAVIHCFSGTREQAHNFLDLGCLLSVTGIVTFKNARDLQALVTEVPLEKIMIETDAPFLSPEPHRGKRNEPLYVKFVVEKIAALKKISYDEVAATTTQTAKDFFKL